MDFDPEELQFWSIPEILRESISILKRSPKAFELITLTLIFPLSSFLVCNSLLTRPLLALLQSTYSYPSQWTFFLVIQFVLLILICAFSLLSTAAVVFTVASLYTSKPISFCTTLSAIPKVFKRLLITFLWVLLLMTAYNSIFILGLFLLILAIHSRNSVLLFLAMSVLAVLFLVIHVYITALWHMASVVSVLERVYGFAAMKKSHELLKGRTKYAAFLVFVYLMCCGMIEGIIIIAIDEQVRGYMLYLVVGHLEVGLGIVNLVGLLVQSVFYYACKSYHHQVIDKTALYKSSWWIPWRVCASQKLHSNGNFACGIHGNFSK